MKTKLFITFFLCAAISFATLVSNKRTIIITQSYNKQKLDSLVFVLADRGIKLDIKSAIYEKGILKGLTAKVRFSRFTEVGFSVECFSMIKIEYGSLRMSGSVKAFSCLEGNSNN